MKRILTAAVVFAGTVGVPGLALAQPNYDNYETGGKPTWAQQAPSAYTSPGTNSPQWGYGVMPPASYGPLPYQSAPPPYSGR